MAHSYPQNVWVGTLKRKFQHECDDEQPTSTLVISNDVTYYLRDTPFVKNDVLSGHIQFSSIMPSLHYSFCKEIRNFRMNADALQIQYVGAQEQYQHRLSPYDTDYVGQKAQRITKIGHSEITFCNHQNHNGGLNRLKRIAESDLLENDICYAATPAHHWTAVGDIYSDWHLVPSWVADMHRRSTNWTYSSDLPAQVANMLKTVKRADVMTSHLVCGTMENSLTHVGLSHEGKQYTVLTEKAMVAFAQQLIKIGHPHVITRAPSGMVKAVLSLPRNVLELIDMTPQPNIAKTTKLVQFAGAVQVQTTTSMQTKSNKNTIVTVRYTSQDIEAQGHYDQSQIDEKHFVRLIKGQLDKTCTILARTTEANQPLLREGNAIAILSDSESDDDHEVPEASQQLEAAGESQGTALAASPDPKEDVMSSLQAIRKAGFTKVYK